MRLDRKSIDERVIIFQTRQGASTRGLKGTASVQDSNIQIRMSCETNRWSSQPNTCQLCTRDAIYEAKIRCSRAYYLGVPSRNGHGTPQKRARRALFFCLHHFMTRLEHRDFERPNPDCRKGSWSLLKVRTDVKPKICIRDDNTLRLHIARYGVQLSSVQVRSRSMSVCLTLIAWNLTPAVDKGHKSGSLS